MANGLHGKNLAQSETLCTWRSSLRGTWEVSSMPGLACRAGSGRRKAARRACTWMRSRMRPYYLRATTPGGSRGGKGLTQGDQPLGGRGSDTEPKCRVDPNNGCASDDERH